MKQKRCFSGREFLAFCRESRKYVLAMDTFFEEARWQKRLVRTAKNCAG